MKPTSPRDLVLATGALASPPGVYMRLNEVMASARSSARDIAEVLSSDPGLTLRLLRLVNSGFYALPQRIEDVYRAVILIGERQIRELALATSVISAFKKIPAHLVDMPAFWRHSLATGVAARALAKSVNERNGERIFAQGLLHDVGSVVLYSQAPDIAGKILMKAAERPGPIVDIERSFLGFDHTEIGKALMAEWNLPQIYQDTARHHHSPMAHKRAWPDLPLVHIADVIVDATQVGTSGEPAVPKLEPGVWEALGLDKKVLRHVVQQVDQVLGQLDGEFLAEANAPRPPASKAS
jgi:HD-like signal output (HDOD) protein